MKMAEISTFPIAFSKDFYCRPVKQGLVWERVNKISALAKHKMLPDIISLANAKLIINIIFMNCGLTQCQNI